MSIKDFTILNRLGDGSFASVWKVLRLADNQEYAMKRVNMSTLSEKERENALNEVQILASIQSPNVIGYREAFFDNESMTLCVVMELASGGDLQSIIQKHAKDKTGFSEQEIWQYLIQILRGLKALHDKKILHRDIKAANILIGSAGEAKIGDLNVSKVGIANSASTQVGTPYYTSPEIWRGQRYDTKCDIWSLGCLIYEMAALKPPFREKDLHKLYIKVVKGAFEKIPNKYSSDLSNIISMCLRTNPIQRPSCDELLNHPIILKNLQGAETSDSTRFPASDLIKTIKVPANIRTVGRRLPKPNYDGLRIGLEFKGPASPKSNSPSPSPKAKNSSDGNPLPFVRVYSAGSIKPQEVFLKQNFILQPQSQRNRNVVLYRHEGPSFQRKLSADREETRKLSPCVFKGLESHRSKLSDISTNDASRAQGKPSSSGLEDSESKRIQSSQQSNELTKLRCKPKELGAVSKKAASENFSARNNKLNLRMPSGWGHYRMKKNNVQIVRRKLECLNPRIDTFEKNDVSQEYKPNEKPKKPYVELYSHIFMK